MIIDILTISLTMNSLDEIIFFDLFQYPKIYGESRPCKIRFLNLSFIYGLKRGRMDGR